MKNENDKPGYYDPTRDKINQRISTDTRKDIITLKHLNRLKKMREMKKLDALKRQDILAVMYGIPVEPQTPGF